MNVLSLFDGMSCGQIALKELGFTVENYFASEIDKYAIAQTQVNFPKTIQLGDVKKVRACDLPKIDLILAGSPCQGFSFAGKQNNFNDLRSALFFEFVRILDECRKINPDIKFLFENVIMKREYENTISEYLGVTPVKINSSKLSAQNRVRLYWSNIRTRRIDLFGTLTTDIPQPKELGLTFKDIMEYDVPERYYVSERVIKNLIAHKERNKNNDNGFGIEIRNITEKSTTLRVGGRGVSDLIDVTEPIGYQRGHGYNIGGITGKKSPTLTSSGWEQNNFIIEPRINNEIEKGKMKFKNKIRRYTPIECSRLQTIPEWYRWNCSETQQYKMLGNGWTIKVIMHILKYLKKQN